MSKSVFVVVCIALVAAQCGASDMEVTSFTSQDATIVSQIAFIAEFSLKHAAASKPLFAEVDGRLLSPVVRVSESEFQVSTLAYHSDSFITFALLFYAQVSWTEEIKKAHRGERTIRIFTEDGFAAVRKVQRAGGDTATVEPFASISVYHGGAFNGPWINSEILAAAISAIVAYVAFSSRSKLLA